MTLRLLDKRLLFVTGKGGVGRTTVSAALGVLAAQHGKRTMVCEVAEQERITQTFGVPAAGFEEREVSPGLFALSVSPQRAQDEWLELQLRSSTLAGLLGHSRVFQYLTAAAPGLRELVTMGKVWELAQLQRRTARSSPYDLVIVDAPATGHGLAMLRSPRTYRDIARTGPIARHAGLVRSFITDPGQSSVIAIARAEEMPVNETLDFERRLREEEGIELDHVVVNGLFPERFNSADVRRIEAVDGRVSAPVDAALAAALSEHHRARSQRSQLRRLRKETAAPVTTLPYVFEPELGPDELERLASELERRS